MVYHYGWSPRTVDELYLPELIDAHAMLPRIRREKMMDMATAMRIARLKKDADFRRALKELE